MSQGLRMSNKNDKMNRFRSQHKSTSSYSNQSTYVYESNGKRMNIEDEDDDNPFALMEKEARAI